MYDWYAGSLHSLHAKRQQHTRHWVITDLLAFRWRWLSMSWKSPGGGTTSAGCNGNTPHAGAVPTVKRKLLAASPRVVRTTSKAKNHKSCFAVTRRTAHKASMLRQPSCARGEGVPIGDVLDHGELKALHWRVRPGLFPLADRPLPDPFHARVTPDTLERGLLLGRVFSNTRPAKISASQGADNTSPTACGGRLPTVA